MTVRADHEARKSADLKLLSTRKTRANEVDMNFLVTPLRFSVRFALLASRSGLFLTSLPFFAKLVAS